MHIKPNTHDKNNRQHTPPSAHSLTDLTQEPSSKRPGSTTAQQFTHKRDLGERVVIDDMRRGGRRGRARGGRCLLGSRGRGGGGGLSVCHLLLGLRGSLGLICGLVGGAAGGVGFAVIVLLLVVVLLAGYLFEHFASGLGVYYIS